MAQEFKHLPVLWLVISCLAAASSTSPATTATTPTPSTSPATTTTTPTPTTSPATTTTTPTPTKSPATTTTTPTPTKSPATTTTTPTPTKSPATTTTTPTPTKSPATTTTTPTPTKSPATTTTTPTPTKSPATTTTTPTPTKSPATTTTTPTPTKSPATTTTTPPPTKSPATTTTTPTPTKSPATTTTTPTPTKSPATTTTTPTPTKSPATTTTTPTPSTSPATTTTTPTPTTSPATTTTTPTPTKSPVMNTTTTPTPTKSPVINTTTTPTPTKSPVINTTTTPTPTKSPVINTTMTSTTTTSMTTKYPGPCAINPCGPGSTCEARARETFVCLCLAGDYYNYDTKTCENAQVFPGQLNLPRLRYFESMSDKTSSEFRNASKMITDELDAVFYTSSGYSGSAVQELQPITKNKDGSRSNIGISASVEIIFRPNSDITSEQVQEKVDSATDCDCLLANASFSETDLCSMDPCELKTTNCSAKNGAYNCTCKAEYVMTSFSGRMCVACPAGQRTYNSLTCESCSFGYSGLNCNESWQLWLVIVGSVLGGLLLITLILLPVVALTPKSSKKPKNTDERFPVSHSAAKEPKVNSSLTNSQAPSVNGVANGLAPFTKHGVHKIPRAAVNSSWDSRNNLEMTPTNSLQNLLTLDRNSELYDDQEDMNPSTQSQSQTSRYTQVQPQNNPYAQVRAQNNPYAQVRAQNYPYAQNRPQVNPYAQSRGQTNPYTTHNNERQFH
ncbi:mucin-13b [Mastacembelus armatus]|uniref:Mucin-13-like n=1 Tax=Mastacembelus armatus TaxID=205130 RepID=A0A3Q3M3M4_9TELE|nr:mucin-13-like [Mastacembelus armatus]